MIISDSIRVLIVGWRLSDTPSGFRVSNRRRPSFVHSIIFILFGVVIISIVVHILTVLYFNELFLAIPNAQLIMCLHLLYQLIVLLNDAEVRVVHKSHKQGGYYAP
jgi:hypothetical protein